MPNTDIVTVYQAKGNSDTFALVIPKKIRPRQMKAGDKYQASVDERGRIIYRKIEVSG